MTEQKTMRVGKTQKDRVSGAQGRNESNKSERTEWMNSSGGRLITLPNGYTQTKDFPSHTCNGKKNRKGGK